MTRTTPKLLSALFVLGCGSGAMASPARGQWTDGPGFNAAAAPTQPAPPVQGPAEDDNVPSNHAPAPAQGGYQDPAQSQNQDQDDDAVVQSQELQTGQSHLGVLVMSLTPELRQFFGVTSSRGVLIARIEPNSAAARAGIQVGDVLVRVGSRGVQSGDDVLQALAAQPGGRIRIGVVRQGRPVRLFATMPSMGSQQTTPEQDRL